MKLVEAYRLEKKIAMLERSVGRGGPSIAMNMWKFLSDNGPSTVADIEAGLGSRYSNGPTIKSYLDAGLITKQGDRYVANPDYEWDDVGKIERPGLNLKDIKAAMDNGEIVSDEDLPDDVPEKPQRQPRARAVKANIFSRKFDEVKAAVDSGVDVNSQNAAGRTALQYALMSDKPDSAKIVKYLLDHNASLANYATGKPLIFEAIKNNNHEAVEALIERGVNIVKITYKNKTVFDQIITCGYTGDLKPFAAYDKNMPAGHYDDQMNAMLTDAYKGGLDESRVLEFIDKMMDLIIENDADNWFYVNFSDTLRSELAANKDDISKSVIMDKLTKAKLWSRAINQGIHDYSVLYPVMEKAYDEKWKLVDCNQGEFNSIAITVSLSEHVKKVDSKMISEMLTPDAIVEASNSNKRFVRNLVSIVRYNDIPTQSAVKIFNSIAKSGVRADWHSIEEVIGCLASQVEPPEKDVTRAGCRLLAAAIKNGSMTSKSIKSWHIRSIVSCDNEYFLEFMVENGFGDMMAASRTSSYASDECRKVLEENGFEIGAKDYDYDRESRDDWNIRHIIDGIQEDESDREFRSLLQNKPELLDDPTVRQVANDPNYRDNFTAKLVQRAIADREEARRNDADIPKYDF